MVTITLDDRDRAVLERLREGEVDVDSLAESVSVDPGYLAERLPELEDNGLVVRAAGGDYALTDDGARVIEAARVGATDDRVDTPPAVEGRILAFDLPPDEEAAVRGAFSFLQYWGEVTAAEILDGVYSEYPAGFDDALAWWRESVRDRLAELPRVEAPRSSDESWRYVGTPVVARWSDDGRDVAGDAVPGRTSARFAIERLDLEDDVLWAVRRVFALLVELETVSATEAKEQVYPDHDAGYGSPDDWWDDCIRTAIESLPSVERVDDDRERWCYRTADV